jgi:hypothetical protein
VPPRACASPAAAQAAKHHIETPAAASAMRIQFHRAALFAMSL